MMPLVGYFGECVCVVWVERLQNDDPMHASEVYQLNDGMARNEKDTPATTRAISPRLLC